MTRYLYVRPDGWSMYQTSAPSPHDKLLVREQKLFIFLIDEHGIERMSHRDNYFYPVEDGDNNDS